MLDRGTGALANDSTLCGGKADDDTFGVPKAPLYGVAPSPTLTFRTGAAWPQLLRRSLPHLRRALFSAHGAGPQAPLPAAPLNPPPIRGII